MKAMSIVLALTAMLASTGCGGAPSLPMDGVSMQVRQVDIGKEWNDYEASEGHTLVCVWLEREDGAAYDEVDTRRLEAVQADVRLLTAAGESVPPEIYGYREPSHFLLFTVPEGSAGLQLEWPGVDVFDLDPYAAEDENE
jgi:hypothetical protein